jgi:hypothetical protein
MEGRDSTVESKHFLNDIIIHTPLLQEGVGVVGCFVWGVTRSN